MKKLVIFAVFLFIVGGGYFVLSRQSAFDASAPLAQIERYATVEISDQSFEVEIADTDALRSKGLSNRASMSANSGMIFLFDGPDTYDFWMKDMQFPLDFVWINNGVVVDITRRVEPVPNPQSVENIPTYKPKSPVDAVLEINAGASDSINIGDEVKITRRSAT